MMGLGPQSEEGKYVVLRMETCEQMLHCVSNDEALHDRIKRDKRKGMKKHSAERPLELEGTVDVTMLYLPTYCHTARSQLYLRALR